MAQLTSGLARLRERDDLLRWKTWGWASTAGWAHVSAVRPRTAASRRAEPTDAHVVARVRGGDAASYALLVRRYNRRLYRVVRAILRDDSEVEDVMQDAYLAAYRKLESFEGRARFSTWLIRIAVNQAIDRLRRTGRFVAFDPTLGEALARVIDARAAGDNELGRVLEGAIEALPTPYRLAYVLRELEGMETGEVADCLGVEEGTVETRVHRARRLLCEALGREVGGPAEIFDFGAERCDGMEAAVLGRIASAV
jgi:RNA polymerase sigma-70 factor (ECF subfamily)